MTEKTYNFLCHKFTHLLFSIAPGTCRCNVGFTGFGLFQSHTKRRPNVTGPAMTMCEHQRELVRVRHCDRLRIHSGQRNVLHSAE